MAAGKPLYRSLYFQVIVAIVIGVLVGFFAPHWGEAMKPLGDAFIKLIKMIIAPIIFLHRRHRYCGHGRYEEGGQDRWTGFALFRNRQRHCFARRAVDRQPGATRRRNERGSRDVGREGSVDGDRARKMERTTEFLMNIIPSTVVDAFAKGEILQVLLFALMFGFALHAFGGRGTLVFDFVEKISHVFFGIVGIIMKVAPIGAFGAMAFTIGKYGIGSMLSLGKLMATFYVTCLLFIFVVLGLIARFHGFSVWKLIKYLKEELFIVLGTSSSEAALPRVMVKLENLGAKKSVVGLVIVPAIPSTSMAHRSTSPWRPFSSRRQRTRHWT